MASGFHSGCFQGNRRRRSVIGCQVLQWLPRRLSIRRRNQEASPRGLINLPEQPGAIAENESDALVRFYRFKIVISTIKILEREVYIISSLHFTGNYQCGSMVDGDTPCSVPRVIESRFRELIFSWPR